MRIFAAIGILLALAACGQTGPLYLPHKQPAPAATPTDDSDSTESQKQPASETEPR